MQSVFKLLLLTLILASCGGGKSYTVAVQNLSAKSFDSIKVYIDTSPGEQPAASFGPLQPGQSTPPLTVGEMFGKQHQKMTGTAIFYAADTVIKKAGSYTGGMVAYKNYKVTINDSLQIKWEEWN